MNFKKVMAAVLAGTMVFGMASSVSAATEVSFWTLSTRQNAVEPIVEAFNEANPDIKVTASFYDTDGIKDACKVAASSDTLPSMWFNWGGSLEASMRRMERHMILHSMRKITDGTTNLQNLP